MAPRPICLQTINSRTSRKAERFPLANLLDMDQLESAPSFPIRAARRLVENRSGSALSAPSKILPSTNVELDVAADCRWYRSSAFHVRGGSFNLWTTAQICATGTPAASRAGATGGVVGIQVLERAPVHPRPTNLERIFEKFLPGRQKGGTGVATGGPGLGLADLEMVGLQRGPLARHAFGGGQPHRPKSVAVFTIRLAGGAGL